MEIAVFCLVFAGGAMLCLAMTRHYAKTFKAPPTGPRRLLLRVAGIVLLAAAFAVAGTGLGWGVGVVEWVGALGLCGVALNTLNGFRPTWTAHAGVLSVLTALVFIGLEKF